MIGNFEAKVATNEQVFRAKFGSTGTIYIIEDGVAGYVDCLNLTSIGRNVDTPEGLLRILISWVYEMKRGYEILETSVTTVNEELSNIHLGEES